MLINSLNKVINHFGSTRQVARVLGIKQQSVSDWRRGRSEVPLDIALHLELLMRGEVDWKELVPFETAYRLKDLCLSLKEAGAYPCELTHVLMSRIIVPDSFSENPQKRVFNVYRSPCINEDYILVFWHEVFIDYKKNNKKTIPCWRLSFEHLAEGRYIPEDLAKAFLITERAGIGMAFEDFIGNRQGQRTDLLKNEKKESVDKELVKNFSQVAIKKGIKTREFSFERLGFKNFTTYEQAKAIFQYGSPKLIQLVDQKN